MATIKMGRNKARITALLLAVLTTLGFSGLIAAPAQAAVQIVCVWTSGASACFNPDGEKLTVCDTAPDSDHAAAAYRGNHDSSWAYKHEYGGNGACTTFDFTMAEDTYIAFHAVRMNGGDVVGPPSPCSGWVSAGTGAISGSCPAYYPPR
jgi:hypothetical protein